MTTTAAPRPTIAVVVYARRSVHDLSERAFRSILSQRRHPDWLIVVDDRSVSGFNDVKERVLDLRIQNCRVVPLMNERTAGLCGAMNTALLRLLEHTDELNTYVVFLREEDELDKRHLESLEICITDGHRSDLGASGHQTGPDVVLSDFKIRSGKDREVRAARSADPSVHLKKLFGLKLDHASCIMASMAVRLENILEAGLFNEALQGMQVHELLLRLSEVSGARWAAMAGSTISSPSSSVHRSEETDEVIQSMRRGSRTFCLLAQHRLPRATETALFSSIKQRRDQLDKSTPALRWGIGYDLKPMKPKALPLPKLTERERETLRAQRFVVGIISRSNCEQSQSGLPQLLDDLRWLSKNCRGVHVEILDNAKRRERRQRWFETLACNGRKFSVSLRRSDKLKADSTTKGFHASIPLARQEMQRIVATRIRREGSEGQVRPFAWFLDDDLSLTNRAMCWTDAQCKAWFLRQLVTLVDKLSPDVKDPPGMLLGQVTDAPPVPATMTYRVQLLDAVTAIRRLRNRDMDAQFQYRDFQRVLEDWIEPTGEVRDFYYDISSRDQVHLEFPFDYFPWENGQFRRSKLRNRDVLFQLLSELPKLARGKQVLRPIFADRHFAIARSEITDTGFPSNTARTLAFAPSILRGGNTLFPPTSECDRYPTMTLPVTQSDDGRRLTPRRADMVSAIICRYLHDKRVVAIELPVRQNREDEGNSILSQLLNPEKYNPDALGFAIYSALKELLDHRRLARLEAKHSRPGKESCSFDKSDTTKFYNDIRRYKLQRDRTIFASFFRIRGLARALLSEIEKVSELDLTTRERQIVETARSFADEVFKAVPRQFHRPHLNPKDPVPIDERSVDDFLLNQLKRLTPREGGD